MSDSNNSWLEKWQYIIDKISQVIKEHGKEIVVFNVDAMPDPVEQSLEKYHLRSMFLKGMEKF